VLFYHLEGNRGVGDVHGAVGDVQEGSWKATDGIGGVQALWNEGGAVWSFPLPQTVQKHG
jgi:hypothetical protein